MQRLYKRNARKEVWHLSHDRHRPHIVMSYDNIDAALLCFQLPACRRLFLDTTAMPAKTVWDKKTISPDIYAIWTNM